jgi:methyl-accepting chemotaxis protein
MDETDTLEEVFKAITNRFGEIAKQVDSINTVIQNLGLDFNNSIMQISEQIESLTNTLQDIMNVSELKNAKHSINEMVETFRKELDPDKLQNLMTDLTKSIKLIKEKYKEKPNEGDK